MASPEELEQQIQDLQVKLKDAETKKSLVFSRDRKFEVLSDKIDVNEWCTTVESHVKARFTTDVERILFITSLLDKRAKAEVKFQHNLQKATLGEILETLKLLYRSKDTLLQLQEKFYSRNQQQGESLEEYAVSLMEVIAQICDKTKMSSTDKAKMIKSKFADGVSDVILRRELVRLNEERSTLSFLELRQHAIEWCTIGEKSDVNALSEGIKFCDIKDLLEKQQAEINSLKYKLNKFQSSNSATNSDKPSNIENVDGSKGRFSVDKSKRSSITCHYCKKLGHIKSECYKLKYKEKKEADLNSKNPAV